MIVGTAGANTETSAVATPSTGSTAGKTSSLSVGTSAGIGVGFTVAAVFVAALFVFLCVRRRRIAKKGHLNMAVCQLGSDDGILAAGHQEYRKSEMPGASARHELESPKTSVTVKEGLLNTSRGHWSS